MIGYLKGIVKHTMQTNCFILDVNGVGYEIYMKHTFAQGEEVDLFIHTQVREDAITLFGFTRLAERGVFLKLTQVPGIGAKAAMRLLAIGSLEKLLDALYAGDSDYLTQGEGIGPKLAKRLLNELKDKIEPIGILLPSIAQNKHQEAASVLINLGYDALYVRGVLDKIEKEHPGQTVEARVRLSLKQLSQRK